MMGSLNRDERLSIALLLAVAVFAGFAFFLPVLSDGDSWWHLAAGDWILRERRVPTVDPFSHSRPGAPWHAHEWLAELVMAAAFRVGGWGGLIALGGTFAAASAALVCHHLLRHLPALASILVTIAAACAVGHLAWMRPHLLALPLLIAWTIQLLLAREKGRAPPLPLAGLMVVWANLHGSFLLGLFLIGSFALEALLEADDKRQAVRAWGLFAFAAAMAAMVTPFGFRGFLFPIEVSSMAALDGISEWRPATFSNAPIFLLLLLGAIVLFLTRPVRMPIVRAASFVILLGLALLHVRHQLVFVAVGTLLAAGPVGDSLRRQRNAPHPPSRLDRTVLLAMLIAAATVLAARLAIPVRLDGKHDLPLAAIGRIPPALRAAPVFNEYSFGGPLIFSGIRPFIDGRVDMYGDAFFADFLAAQRGEAAALAMTVKRHGIRWALLTPDSPAAAHLRSRGWTQIDSDGRAVTLVHPQMELDTVISGKRSDLNR